MTFPQALNDAIEYLERSDRFESEVRDRLETKGGTEHVDEVIERLKQRGFIDDERALSSAIEVAERTGKKGPERLRPELLRRGANPEMLDAALAAMDPTKAINLLVEEKVEKGDPPAKIARFLSSRGFSEEQVEAAIGRFFEE